MIVIVWAVISLLLFAYKLLLYGLYLKMLKKKTRLPHKEISDYYYLISKETGIKKPPTLYINSDVESPFVSGLFKKKIFISSDDYDKETLRFVFIHELTHYKQKDLTMKLFANIALSVNFFNPFIYFANNKFANEIEMCCDETVIKSLSEKERAKYGETILNAARKR